MSQYISSLMIENNVEVLIVRSDDDFAGMKHIRQEVFVKEHNIPAEKEFDGNDYCATHILAKVDGKPAGTMRIRYFADFVKFERMAVLKEFRKSALSDMIMNKGFDFVSRKGYNKVYGECKKELLARWQACGYEQVYGAPLAEQNGMTLIPIMRRLPENPNAVRITNHPEVLNAKEDEWEKEKRKVLQKQKVGVLLSYQGILKTVFHS